MKKILIIGNPNSGKSSLFNLLTGEKSNIANWSGVTVEKLSANIIGNEQTLELIDLPGLYSLSLSQEGSNEEHLARKIIENEGFDLIINTIDVLSLERSLYLTLELMDLNIPIVLVLTKNDLLAKKGFQLDMDALEKLIGISVIEMNPREGEGRDVLISSLKADHASPSVAMVASNLSIETQLNDEDSKAALRFEIIAGIANETRVKRTQISKDITQRIDSYVLSPFWGLPIFFMAMLLVFTISINFAGIFQELIEYASQIIFVDLTRHALNMAGFPEFLTHAIANGLGGGVSVVITFAPIIFGLYCMLGILADSGYISRAAFIMDAFMRKLGLSGKAFIPLIIGFGCNVPSIMATRILKHKNEKIIISMMSPFMSCGARLSIYALFCAAFFPKSGGLIVFSLYLIGIAVAVLTGLLLRKIMPRAANSNMLMDLPNYNAPSFRFVMSYAMNKTNDFVFGAGKTIVAVFVVLTLMNSYNTQFQRVSSKDSIIATISQGMTPAFKYIGIAEENWPAVVGLVTGIFAKEVLVGTLNALYTNDDKTLEGSEIEIKTIASKFGSNAAAYAYLLFILLYFPCVSVYGAIASEIGHRWALISAVWSTSVAYIIAALFFQISLLV